MEDERHPEITYADDRVPSRFILAVLAGLVVFSTLLCVVAWRILVVRERQLHFQPFAPAAPIESPIRSRLFDLPQPRLPLAEQQRESLEHYGWVDRSRGLVRIPVEREIDLMLEKR
jgi:hypothetical protein